MLVFASFMIILNQNTGLEQTVTQTRQMDQDKANEHLTITDQGSASGTDSITINCILNNTGTLPVQIERLWVEDLTINATNSVQILPTDAIYILQQGQANSTSKSINIPGASSTDNFRFWFVTARGNQFTLQQSSGGITNTQIANMIHGGLSAVFGDFLPDYHSTQWAKVDVYGNIVGNWASGWIIPSNLGTINMVWRMNVSYYGSVPLTIDRNSMLVYYPFAGQNPGSKAPALDFIVNYTTGKINPYAGKEISVASAASGVGTNLTLYFGSNGAPNLNGGIPNDAIDSLGDMLTLTIYGQAPSTYAQSFPLFAIFTRAVPILNLNPSSGRIGSSVTVSGQQFSYSSAINIYFDTQEVATAQSDSSGRLASTVFTVPTAVAGVHTITAVDADDNSGTATFTVLAPTLSLTPNSGFVGTQVTVSGTNFNPSSTVTITFDGATVATTTATSSGTLPTGGSAPKFTVQTINAGSHTISANDGVNSVSATFTVNPSIVINPTSGPRNSPNTITVSGTGFAANSIVTIKFEGNLQSTTPTPVPTDNLGSFSAITFTVTPGGKNGATHTVTATDLNSNIAQTTFTGTN